MNVIDNIICSDVIDGLKQIPENIVTLIVTSPPYNVGIEYDNRGDDQPYTEYLSWLKSVYTESKRVLRKGGRLIVNIDAMTNRQADKDQEYSRCIYAHTYNIMKELGMLFFGEHIWWKNGVWNGKKTAWGSYMSPSLPAVRRSYEYILVYSKEQFKLEKDEFSGEPDITAAEFQNYIDSRWVIQPETKNLGNHPCPYPLELPTRCIKLYSYPNDIILDPFSGTGTTCLAAKMLKRRYIGIDNSPEYVNFSLRRLSAEANLFA